MDDISGMNTPTDDYTVVELPVSREHSLEHSNWRAAVNQPASQGDYNRDGTKNNDRNEPGWIMFDFWR
jgi:hypothetical protein